MRCRSLLFFAAFSTLGLRAHPELEAALARVNARLAAAPQDASLYLERGEIYALAGDAISADANYHVAATLHSDLPRLARAQAALALRQHQPAESIRLLARALTQDPNDAEARIIRARAWLASGHRANAAGDFAAALDQLDQPAPEIFLEYAACAEQPEEAIRRLDAGCERLGDVPALMERALTVEESTGLVDRAVARLDRIIARVERPESWLKRRGDLLQRAGRAVEARASYVAAREVINRLPAWLRESPATSRLTTELAGLPSSASSP